MDRSASRLHARTRYDVRNREERIVQRRQRALSKLAATRCHVAPDTGAQSRHPNASTSVAGRQQPLPEHSPAAEAQEALDAVTSTKEAAQAQVHDVATKGANALTRRIAKQRTKYQSLVQAADQCMDAFATQLAACVEQLPRATPADPQVYSLQPTSLFYTLPPQEMQALLDQCSNQVAALFVDKDQMLTELQGVLTDADADFIGTLQRHADQASATLQVIDASTS